MIRKHLCIWLEHIDPWPWEQAFECLICHETRAPLPGEKVKGKHRRLTPGATLDYYTQARL